MLKWTLIFVVLSLIAGVLGFTNLATSTAGIAKILFYLFIILFLISLVFGKRINL